MQNKKDLKKIKWPTIIYGLIIFLVFCVAIDAIMIYAFDSNNSLVQKTENIVPFPIANWGTSFITVAKLKNNLNSAKMFYENQDFSAIGMRVDFGTSDGTKRLEIKEKNILNKLIEDKMIENEAIKRGLTLRPEDISQEVSRKMQEYNSEEYLKNNLAKLYGWNIQDFEDNIVKPDMYKTKLAANLRQTDPKTINAKNKIESALKDLQNGANFDDLVRKYSEGDSAKNGGDLGWFSPSEMLPEIAISIANLKAGNRSDIIESQVGYHIIFVEDRKTENGVDKFKLKQIFVRTLNFSDWLFNYEKNIGVHIFSRDLYWNKNNAQVEFKNPDLKSFEENLSKNSAGDISVLF